MLTVLSELKNCPHNLLAACGVSAAENAPKGLHADLLQRAVSKVNPKDAHVIATSLYSEQD